MFLHTILRRTFFLLLPSTVALLTIQGCVATRDWVTEQISPLAGRVSGVEGRASGVEDRLAQVGDRLSSTEGRLAQVDAKAEKALSNFSNLRLERRLVLNLKEGANFAFNSTVLTEQVRREIDGFFSDLKGDVGEMSSAVFLVAGHTDNVGSEDYNYELGRKRAENVARYLIIQKQADPLRVVTVSYGKSAPLSDNASREGRGRNRRVEIVVYKEAMTVAGDTKPNAAARAGEETERRITAR